MTISNTTQKVIYNGNGSTTTFAIPFAYFEEGDVVVVLRDESVTPATEQTLTVITNYTLTGGTATTLPTDVEMIVAPTSDEKLLVKRAVPLTQQLDYVEGAQFPAEDNEEGLDRSAVRDQQLQEQLDRAVLFSESSATTNITFPDPEADKFIAWNTAGDNLENRDGTANDAYAVHIDTVTPDDSANEFSGASDLSGALSKDDRILVEDQSSSAQWRKGYGDLEDVMDLGIKVSTNDTTPSMLEDKIVVSDGSNSTNILEKTTLNDAGDEDIQIQIDEGKIDHGNLLAASLLDDDHTQYSPITTGAADPIGNVTPARKGEIYVRDNNEVYISYGTLNTEWTGVDAASVSLSQLTDTEATITSGAAEGEAVVFNATSGKWENRKLEDPAGAAKAGETRAVMIRTTGVGSTGYDTLYHEKPMTYNAHDVSNVNNHLIDKVHYITTGEYYVQFKPGKFTGLGPMAWGSEVSGEEGTTQAFGCALSSPSGVHIDNAANTDFILHLQQSYDATPTKLAGELFNPAIPAAKRPTHNYGARVSSLGDYVAIFTHTASYDFYVGISTDGGRTFDWSNRIDNAWSEAPAASNYGFRSNRVASYQPNIQVYKEGANYYWQASAWMWVPNTTYWTDIAGSFADITTTYKWEYTSSSISAANSTGVDFDIKYLEAHDKLVVCAGGGSGTWILNSSDDKNTTAWGTSRGVDAGNASNVNIYGPHFFSVKDDGGGTTKFIHVSGQEDTGGGAWTAGDIVMCHGTLESIMSSDTWSSAIVIQNPSTGTTQNHLIGAHDDGTKAYFVAACNDTSNKLKLYLSWINDLTAATPTVGSQTGSIHPFDAGNGHYDVATLETDRHNGYNDNTNFLSYTQFIEQNIVKISGTNTLLVLHQFNNTSELEIHLGVIVIPDYTDLTGDKAPWFLPIKAGTDEGGTKMSFAEAQFMTDGTDFYVVYRKHIRASDDTSGAIYMEKLNIDGSGTVANAKQLVPDPFFDNGLAYGTGTLAAWTTTGAPTSTNAESLACIALNASDEAKSAAMVTTASTVYHVSGYYRCSAAGTTPTIKFLDANDSDSQIVTPTVLADPGDYNTWREFNISFTCDTTSTKIDVSNAGTGVVNFTNLIMRKEFVQIIDNQADPDYYGVKQVSNRPVDANGNVDIAENFCGDISVSEDKQTLIWSEKDNLGETRPFLNNLRARS
jgi:hypothetical protein